MDALVHYSSDSDQGDDEKATPSAPPPPTAPPTNKLPSADALFDGGAVPLLGTGVKRPTPPSALAACKPPTKLQRGAKQPTEALLPPQLKGRFVQVMVRLRVCHRCLPRSNVVTEDLGRLFTQRRAVTKGTSEEQHK